MKISSVEFVEHCYYCDVCDEYLWITGKLRFYDAVGGYRFFYLDNVSCGEEGENCPYWKKCMAKQEAMSIWSKRANEICRNVRVDEDVSYRDI